MRRLWLAASETGLPPLIGFGPSVAGWARPQIQYQGRFINRWQPVDQCDGSGPVNLDHKCKFGCGRIFPCPLITFLPLSTVWISSLPTNDYSCGCKTASVCFTGQATCPQPAEPGEVSVNYDQKLRQERQAWNTQYATMPWERILTGA